MSCQEMTSVPQRASEPIKRTRPIVFRISFLRFPPHPERMTTVTIIKKPNSKIPLAKLFMITAMSQDERMKRTDNVFSDEMRIRRSPGYF